MMRNIATILLSLSIVYFSYSVIVLTKEVSKVRQELPTVLSEIQALEDDLAIKEWLDILKRTDEKIPELMAQMERIRLTSEKISSTIPIILEESKQLRTKALPQVIKEFSYEQQKTIPQVLQQLRLAQSDTLPNILSESAKVRTMIPVTLERTHRLISQADDLVNETDVIIKEANHLSQQAAKGAVTGTVEGIVTAPLELLKSTAKKLTNTEEDPSNE